MNFKIRDDCRLCFSKDLQTILELADTPLANEFVAADNLYQSQDKFPLYLARCRSCGHVQLPVVVDPARLFSSYVYVSGTSQSFVDHFERYAHKVIQTYSLKPGDLVVEIGSNDGTLLRFFKQAGMQVLGVDPAQEIAKTATVRGIETICEFFNGGTAELIKSKYGLAKLVIANNVFAHADDLHEIAQATKSLLDPLVGHFIFEVQYLVDLVEDTLFDMVYHEHLSYHSLEPLISFFNILDMRVMDVERVNTHGGSIRVSVSTNLSNDNVTPHVSELINFEHQHLTQAAFNSLSQRVEDSANGLKSLLNSSTGKVVGYGAPAKLTTLMYQFKLKSTDFAYIVDDSPWKQGLFTPGLHIPVVSSQQMQEPSNRPDHIVIFAWNFADSIAKKFPEFSGKFIVPLPVLKEL
jgi:SAM-dependent methyltransferase